MTTRSTSSTSAADEPPPYCESMNVNEHYHGTRWAEQQPHKNDLSLACNGTFYFYALLALLLHALHCLGPHGKPPTL
uniref:Uncharacterized protein n=1 Tax=Romanomermis culicivorax TaxID=13658 RepID=A0A915J4X3_ROMCU